MNDIETFLGKDCHTFTKYKKTHRVVNTEQLAKIYESNREYLSNLSSELIKDMLLNILTHNFLDLDVEKEEFKITFKDFKFDSAELLLVTEPYENVKVELDLCIVIVSKQNGHSEFHQVSKFPTEFLYMFK